jgi:hypothetical protein
MTILSYGQRPLQIVCKAICLDLEQNGAAEVFNLTKSTVNSYYAACRHEAQVKTTAGLVLWLALHGYITLNDAGTAYEPTKNVNHLRHRD